VTFIRLASSNPIPKEGATNAWWYEVIVSRRDEDDFRGFPCEAHWNFAHDRLVASGNRRHRKLRLHEGDFVTACLKVVEQIHCDLGGGVLEIVHEHVAVLLSG
jgi:hypothetical protein